MQRERQMFPPINGTDDAAVTAPGTHKKQMQKPPPPPRQLAPKFGVKTAEEDQFRTVAASIAAVSRLICRVETALEVG